MMTDINEIKSLMSISCDDFNPDYHNHKNYINIFSHKDMFIITSTENDSVIEIASANQEVIDMLDDHIAYDVNYISDVALELFASAQIIINYKAALAAKEAAKLKKLEQQKLKQEASKLKRLEQQKLKLNDNSVEGKLKSQILDLQTEIAKLKQSNNSKD